jgi:hypothetical protein
MTVYFLAKYLHLLGRCRHWIADDGPPVFARRPLNKDSYVSVSVSGRRLLQPGLAMAAAMLLIQLDWNSIFDAMAGR